MMMLEVVAKNLENYFTKGKEILIGFEVLIFFSKPVVQDLNIDPPNDIIKEA